MIKNNRGATLAMLLVVFSVLMIFGVFIISFMVNENKMAISHEKKTQAYYVARSGAVAVEAAILQLDEPGIELLESKLSPPGIKKISTEKISFGEGKGEADVTLSLDGRNLLIEATGKINGAEDTVTKVMKKYIDTPMIALNSLSPNLESSDPQVARTATYEEIASGIYPDVEGLIPNSIAWEGGEAGGVEYKVFTPITDGIMTLNGGTDGDVVNYVYNGRLVFKKSGGDKVIIKTNGKVNLYINGGLEIDQQLEMLMNAEEEPDSLNKPEDLNIYVVDNGADEETQFIDIGLSNNSRIRANITTNTDSNVRMLTHANNFSDEMFFRGSIYAPKATVTLGDNNKIALTYKGTIVANNIYLGAKNSNTTMEGKFIDAVYKDNNKEIPIYVKGPFKQ